MGVPLAASPGPGGGYSLIRDRRLLPLSLSSDEAIGMVLSYESFLQYAQSPFSAQSLSAITKLRNAMPPDVVREMDRIHEHVAVVEEVRSYTAPWLAEVLQAALDGVHLRIVYESISRVSERLIYPYGLYAWQGFWYCACYDGTRQASLGLRGFGVGNGRDCLRVGADAAWATDGGGPIVQAMLAHLRRGWRALTQRGQCLAPIDAVYFHADPVIN